MNSLSRIAGYLVAGGAGGIAVNYVSHRLLLSRARFDARREDVRKWRNFIGRTASTNITPDWLFDADYLSLRRHVSIEILDKIEQ